MLHTLTVKCVIVNSVIYKIMIFIPGKNGILYGWYLTGL